MKKYTATVMVEYVFDFDDDDLDGNTFKDPDNYAYYNFNEYTSYADVYSVDVTEEEMDEEE